MLCVCWRQRFFAKYEFSSRFLLSSSECEPLSLAETLQLADDDCRRMCGPLCVCVCTGMHTATCGTCLSRSRCRWDNLSLSYTGKAQLAVAKQVCMRWPALTPRGCRVAGLAGTAAGDLQAVHKSQARAGVRPSAQRLTLQS